MVGCAPRLSIWCGMPACMRSVATGSGMCRSEIAKLRGMRLPTSCEAQRNWRKSKGIDLKTFVFPRNHVGNVSLLVGEGYVGFRNAHPIVGRHGRLGNLARELNVWEASQDPEPVRGGRDLQSLLGPAPLLNGEDAAAYDELRRRMHTAVAPADVLTGGSIGVEIYPSFLC